MQLKENVAVKFDIVVDQICLIHSGKILYDAEELIGRGITDDTLVHMVVKSAGAQVLYVSVIIVNGNRNRYEN